MKFLVLLIFIAGVLPFKGHAQLFGNQDKKIMENNMAQITLLKTYSDYLDKGLSTVHNGLELTHSLKNGEFGLHSLYYNSLLQVNPNIKKYPLAQQTVDTYAKMEKLHNDINNNVSGTDMLSAREKQSLKTLVFNLMGAAGKDMERLDNLLTDGKYQLTDDERIRRIEAIHKSVLGKCRSLNNIAKRVNTIIQGRKQQKAATSLLNQLYKVP